MKATFVLQTKGDGPFDLIPWTKSGVGNIGRKPRSEGPLNAGNVKLKAWTEKSYRVTAIGWPRGVFGLSGCPNPYKHPIQSRPRILLHR